MEDRLTRSERYTLIILFYINILNYMDRYTVAGVLGEIRDDFQIGDDSCGLLQTAFLISYTIFAPIFGYLGDRYSRRAIMVCSVLFWTSATVLCSFMTTYRSFFFLRTFVGIGEASFTSLAPTVIYDVTYKEIRKNALALFYIAIPIGAGLGFAVGSKTSSIGGHWSWGLRVTPVLAVIGSVLLYFIKDPVRGERERLEAGKVPIVKSRSYKNDLKGLIKNRSYILSTFGFTSVTFATGALSWWGPLFLHSGFRLIPGHEDITMTEVAIGFGTFAVITGIFGVPLGAYLSKKLNPRFPAIDPILCGVGLILSDPLIVVALFYSNRSIAVTYASVCVGEIFMNITWTIVADILLSVVVPQSRSTAEAFQIAICHALGDAGSPYLVGVLSEFWKSQYTRTRSSSCQKDMKLISDYDAMRSALLSIVIMQLLGGILFIVSAIWIESDREIVIQLIANASTRPSNDETEFDRLNAI